MSSKRDIFIENLRDSLSEDGMMATGHPEEIIYTIDDINVYGGYDGGIRGVDHNNLLDDDITWEDLINWGTVVVPETASYISNQNIELFENLGYEKIPEDENDKVGYKSKSAEEVDIKNNTLKDWDTPNLLTINDYREMINIIGDWTTVDISSKYEVGDTEILVAYEGQIVRYIDEVMNVAKIAQNTNGITAVEYEALYEKEQEKEKSRGDEYMDNEQKMFESKEHVIFQDEGKAYIFHVPSSLLIKEMDLSDKNILNEFMYTLHNSTPPFQFDEDFKKLMENEFKRGIESGEIQEFKPGSFAEYVKNNKEYIVIDARPYQEHFVFKTNDRLEAMEVALSEFESLSRFDKKDAEISVRMDIDENGDHDRAITINAENFELMKLVEFDMLGTTYEAGDFFHLNRIEETGLGEFYVDLVKNLNKTQSWEVDINDTEKTNRLIEIDNSIVVCLDEEKEEITFFSDIEEVPTDTMEYFKNNALEYEPREYELEPGI